ncbi:spermatogenesis-associated protein 1-like isoform X7 [Apostichopus japonicus]|uniref:spermatogenesis-associated protein 1-like isoform X7 n=1 Tax=Stichopus japonicus TaxID=307972 RepID=UPI003AB3BB6F
MVVTTKMNSAPLPPLRPDSEQLVDLHVYQVPEEVWNLKYRSAYNEVINETISIGFVRVWPELSIWNLRTELLNQLGPDCVPGEFVYVRSVGRCLTKVKGRQELELKVKAFLPPRNFAPEIFILEAPQDVPDTALIEASKQETATREDEGASSMEIDGENDKDEETNVEKEPHHSDTTPSEGRDYEQRESPRKGGRQETFTKHTNSDSGLGEQTPEEISERIQRENHGPQTTSKDLESSRQPHYENDGHLPIGKDRIQEHEDPDLRHRSEHQGYFKDSPRGGYQNNQNYDSPRTQRPPQYEEGPGPDQRPMENYTGGYSHRDPSVPGQGHTQQPGGSYEDDESPRGVYQPSRGPGRSMGQGNHDHRYQEERYDPQGEHSSGFQESVNAWEEGRPHDGQDGGMDDARNTQKAMAYLQLSSDHAPSPKLYPRLPSSDSPSEASSSAVSSSNPEKQRIMSQMKEEQQARLDMEKIREELIKKAKSLQGKTIDRRKKDGMTEMLQARDYWKKRYYDEKKKTPGLEDQVAKLANQVQLQNRKLMSHLEGKGAKAPKGPPSKRMDHKIQIFKHQYDLDDVKRQVDNARMKLGTEIKLRTQAETELRILKSEVTQKKINVTLKRGKQLQAVQKSSGGKLTYQTPRPTGR